MPRAATLAQAPPTLGASPVSRRRLARAASLEDQKRAFLRLVSHELRTPLNSILGFSEILAVELYGPLGAPQYREYAEIIRGSGRKLLLLVNQVLEIGRLEGLTLEVRPEALDPALDAAMASLADDLAGRDVNIRVIGVGQMPTVQADPWGLGTVLSHLLRNAVSFSPDRGEVRVRAERRGRFVEIFIEDDGQGVEPADLPRLMLPFEQGENALARRVDGAGLGLPICDLTCRAMGGRLTLVSAPGKGMVAVVRLRAA
ncbi:HAMP domain-containing sensor histidine kinase [Phenylobacterium sp.]|uniref:sensor histidine kinase n=1 Tax=Phenylobacterium sp. TaxID=1871053 RepID=UPI00286CC2AA|nr:HAMP domain-containing sensor histidine kinase [Phenylobacterium sp.]